MTSTNPTGEGTRRVTSAGADNIGAGESFTGKRTEGGEVSGPAPVEKMAQKRRDVDNAEHDDSSAYKLHEDLTPVPNTEPPPDRPKPGGTP
ncbi:MAG: hypothetical protein EOO22_10135 [Comamonadaceae bacterium]|nr:MAG: hypothetical protein EOO22_10135 [Comamonadaceae bacterium]